MGGGGRLRWLHGLPTGGGDSAEMGGLTLRQARSGGCAQAHIGHRNVTQKFHTTDSTLARGRHAGFVCKRKKNEGERSTKKAEGEKDNI